ncbi:MAG: serine/threonine-protein kinase, partial [Planctomycetota bacterium]
PDTLVEFLGHKKHAQDPAGNSLIQDALAQSRELLGNQTQQDSSASDVFEDAEVRAPSELGVYQLIRPLGQGGMGSVYLAKHRKLGKELAIKILPARRFRNQVFAARFQREIRAAGELEHPSIVRATDAGEEHGTHYLVMEHIDGLDLSQLSRAVGKLSIADACELMRNVALGLSHAHSQGIIHRDVKPSNLMLSKTGETKILDFGLARIGPWEGESAELTTVGQLMGTLDYMAPEQAERADAVDYRADLYSLGATLFRLLCGRAPLAASPDLSPLAKLRLMATHEPPSLDTLRPDAPRELVELVSRLLSRDPANRPASADHVAEELSRLTEGHQLVELSTKAIELKKDRAEAEAKSIDEPKVLLQRTGSNQSRSSGKVWLALALVPLLILAGIWITLETQKGLLVIESEAEATVKLLKDGNDFQEVEVKPGPNSTRIYAGKYEVVLAEGSDSLKLTQEQISVTRGGTSIAKLHWDKPSASNDGGSSGGSLVESPNDNSSSTPITEPVFRGKTLSTYLNMLSYERSSEGLGEAFVAIQALTTSENAGTVQRLLLTLLPKVNGDLEVKPKENYTSSVDYEAFKLLKEVNSDSEFRDLLLDQLNSASGEWRARLASEFSRVEFDQIGPCINWLEKEVVAAGKQDKLFDIASNQLLIWYVSVEDQPAIQQTLKTLLQTSEAFDRHFWLNQMQFSRHDNKQAILGLAKPLCLETMEDADESPQFLAQAAIMLLALLDGDQVNEQERASLRNSIRARLGEIDDSMLLEMTNLNSNFSYEHTVPSWKIDSRSSRALSQFPNPYAGRGGRGSVSMGALRFDFSGAQATSLPAKLLYLARRLEVDLEDLAEKWMLKTESAYQSLAPILSEHRGFIEMSWPALQLDSVQSVSSRSSSNSTYAKLSSIKPETWIGYFLYVQAKGFLPAVEEEDAAQSTPPARTRSTSADLARAAYQGRSRTAATPSSDPLYKGRPLQEWMRILPLEKSQEGVEEALAAIQASLTKEARLQLMQMLKLELPTVGWTRSAHYRTAFSIMRRADSKEYCKFIIEQLETTDGADAPDSRWKNILVSCSIAPESKLGEIEPIHKWIVSNGLVEDSVWLKTCSEMYRRISSDKMAAQSLAEAMVQALMDCESLRENDSFWYGAPHGSPGSSTDPSEIWMKVVGDRTMEVWADFDASKERVAAVGRFLQRFVGRTYTSEQRNKGLWR